MLSEVFLIKYSDNAVILKTSNICSPGVEDSLSANTWEHSDYIFGLYFAFI